MLNSCVRNVFQGNMNDQDKLYKVSIRFQGKINNAVKPLLDQFGVNYFYYCRVSNSGWYSSFSNNVEWNKWWFDKKIHQEAFYFLQPGHYRNGFTLSFPFFEKQFSQIQKIASEQFDIHYILELTYKSGKGIESYGFSSSQFNHSILAYYLSELSSLKLFFKYFRERHPEIFNQLDENQFNLAKEIGSAFSTATTPLFQEHPPFSFFKNIGMDIFSELSQREKQICENLIKGLSANEIAYLFHLSKRTVEYYIENIKGKLNCLSKSELVEKCLDLATVGYFNAS